VTDRIWSCVELQWDRLGGPMPERPARHEYVGRQAVHVTSG
jgi:hypothetical protein